MADNSNNILNQLQQHSLQPPDGAFEKAWEEITLQKSTAAPASEKEMFGQLQDYYLHAPAMDFKTVLAAKKETLKKKPVYALPKSMLRAAAVLLVIAAGIGIYLSLPLKEEPAATYAKQDAENTVIDNDSSSGAGAKETVTGAKKAVAVSKEKIAKEKMAVEKLSGNKTKNIGGKAKYGGSNQYYNNDIFYTLVNYKEYGKERLFKKALADQLVVLNKYSYINISDKMAAMLKDVYVTKKNGKPSRKAKKAKKKFEKWRKKDEKYFDKRIEKNPSDIIDLSGFLMDN